MPQNVLTMPVRESGLHTHEHGVYSIQKTRDLVEPLCQDPTRYLAFREAGGGAMHWLYQEVSVPGLQLDPQLPLPPQISQWHDRLRDDQQKISAAQQVRLSNYTKAITKNLGGDYRKVQLFYMLGPWQDDETGGSAPVYPLGPLPRKPRPDRNPMSQKRYSLEDVCNKRILA